MEGVSNSMGGKGKKASLSRSDAFSFNLYFFLGTQSRRFIVSQTLFYFFAAIFPTFFFPSCCSGWGLLFSKIFGIRPVRPQCIFRSFFPYLCLRERALLYYVRWWGKKTHTREKCCSSFFSFFVSL